MAEDDLLSGSVPDLKKAEDSFGAEEHRHRLNLQRSLFSSGLAFAALLYMTALAMGFILLYMLNQNPDIHWHASLLIAAFVIPPTIIVLGLVRSIFGDKKQKDDDAIGVPIADMTKEVMKKALDVLAKTDPAPKP